MAAYGYAHGEDIANYGNERLRRGDNPAEVVEAVQQAQLWGATPLRASLGLASSQELADYGNGLLKAGVRPEAADRLVTSALFPKKMQIPPEILAMYPPESRAKYLPDLPAEPDIKPTYGTS